MDVEFPKHKYSIIVLREGFRTKDEKGAVHRGGGIVLVKGPHILLVGTGLPSEKDTVLAGLTEHGHRPEDVEYVICTDAHPEFTGNLNLFPRATHIIGFDIMKEDHDISHDFIAGIPYEIDDWCEVLPSSGRTQSAVAVLVSDTNLGTVAIAGSTFVNRDDLEDPDVWMEESRDCDAQQQSRIDILRDANYIVPRYGPLFMVPDSYKSEMKVVMTP